MNYNETLNRIHSLNKFGSRPGLDRVKKLLTLMGNPQDSLRFVHVAGTNGKGSTCQMISSVLCASGYRTGLFISPFITDFCERIQIDGEPIPQDELSMVAEYVFSLSDKLYEEGVIITEFEFVMCVAFEYFKRQRCDIVVLEVGLGGELDCTNVIKPPLCAVITRIGLDHTDILGDTIAAIAHQKCGIIKSGTQVVSSPQTEEAIEVIGKVCKERQTPLVVSDPDDLVLLKDSLEGLEFEYRGERLGIRLVGEHQLENAATALKVIDVLSEKGYERITRNSIREGLGKAENPARFECLATDPHVIIDGAHNPDGVGAFCKGVRRYLGDRQGVLVLGMLRDKDSRTSIKLLEGLFETVYTVPINNPRALSAPELAQLVSEHFDRVFAADSVEEGFLRAYERAKQQESFLCVCGSLYMAGEIRPYILQNLS